MNENNNYIIIVSGLPRSGTSMMMAMIEAGGISVVSDEIRKKDIDNPKGYFEFEKVKKIKEDDSWLPQIEGKAVKMVSRLLKDLPNDRKYKIIFMKRKLIEIIASQKKMLKRSGKQGSDLGDKELEKLFRNHLSEIDTWLKIKDNIDYMYADYNEIINNPKKCIKSMNHFLNNSLNENKMLKIIDLKLYRNRY